MRKLLSFFLILCVAGCTTRTRVADSAIINYPDGTSVTYVRESSVSANKSTTNPPKAELSSLSITPQFTPIPSTDPIASTQPEIPSTQPANATPVNNNLLRSFVISGGELIATGNSITLKEAMGAIHAKMYEKSFLLGGILVFAGIVLFCTPFKKLAIGVVLGGIAILVLTVLLQQFAWLFAIFASILMAIALIVGIMLIRRHSLALEEVVLGTEALKKGASKSHLELLPLTQTESSRALIRKIRTKKGMRK